MRETSNFNLWLPDILTYVPMYLKTHKAHAYIAQSHIYGQKNPPNGQFLRNCA